MVGMNGCTNDAAVARNTPEDARGGGCGVAIRDPISIQV